MTNKIPVRLMLLPPIISSGIVGLGFAVFVYGISIYSGLQRNIVVMWSGVGILIGFLWGSLIWSGRLVDMYQPRVYSKEVKAEKIEPVQLQVIERNGPYMSGKYIELPAGIELPDLVRTAKLLEQNGYEFTHSIAGSGMPLSRKQFSQLRSVMIKTGLAKWRSDKSHQQGCELTTPGMSMFKYLLTYEGGKPPGLVGLLDQKQAHTRAHGAK